MRRKQRSIVTCGHLECVADIPRNEAFTDALGTHWCASCQVRGLLINYGAWHGFPLVETAASALGLIEGET